MVTFESGSFNSNSTPFRSKNLGPTMATIVHSAHMDIFQNLAVDLDNEGRYLFLNAIANQLRYPNSHTHYFSCAILYLFVEANSEAIQVSEVGIFSRHRGWNV